MSLIESTPVVDMKNYLKVGDQVFGKFGPAAIKKIEFCNSAGDKYGIVVDKIWTKDIERCVFDMDNGHFEYGKDIDYITF